MLVVFSALSFAAAATALAATSNTAPQIPLYYEFAGYPRIQTNISWGTPAQAPISVIFDTGSVAFWTYGPNATINDGSPYLATPGPCNRTAKHFFNWPNSSTYSNLVDASNVYSYGGNSKFIITSQVINDTISFGHSSTAPIQNVQVALSNYTIIRQRDEQCDVNLDSFDQSILGVGPFGVGGALPSSDGPSFRSNLRAQGKSSSNTMSMWMNKAPADVKGTYRGTALFGQPLPKTAYSGKLISVDITVPDRAYVGYYTSRPSMSVGVQQIGVNNQSDTSCLIDSGTGEDQLPYKLAEISMHSKVIDYNTPQGYIVTAWNGSCDSIPANATFDLSFPGAKKGESAVIKVPVRSYVRGTDLGLGGLPKEVCGLAITLDNSACVFGAPFFTAAALQFDDDKKTISIAQGGVA